MLQIEQHQQADGTYYIGIKDLLVETAIEQIIEALKSGSLPKRCWWVLEHMSKALE